MAHCDNCDNFFYPEICECCVKGSNFKDIEEDWCIWKVLHEGCFIQNPHTKRLFSNEESMQNVYCNTCGKKIKKVN
jgi:hypothetical protein